MTEPVFESHAHYLFRIPIGETVRVFRQEMTETNAQKIAFLSIPIEYDARGNAKRDDAQNVKGLFLKYVFSPDAYCLGGLIHPKDYSDKKATARDFLRQAEKYAAVGFDGMKMLEGYPTFLKYTKIPLDSEVYDLFYSFAEENRIPVTMHAGNPDESWDLNTTDMALVNAGRVYDASFPSKEEITDEVFRVLRKHPKLRLTLAHCGFFSHHPDDAKRFFSYENTKLDITPGGEQLIWISEHLSEWLPIIEENSTRFLYGTDFYAMPKRDDEAAWKRSFTVRPRLIHEMFEDTVEHLYYETPFHGISLSADLRKKIYMENALTHYGTPAVIDMSYLLSECERLLPLADDPLQREDLQYILNYDYGKGVSQ